MNYMRMLFIFILAVSSRTYAQSDSLTVNEIRNKFKSFKYAEVVSVTEDFISGRKALSRKKLLEILELRAISFYSLGNIKSSLSTFIKILENDPDFQLNPQTTSPKIIEFFEEIRANFRQDSVIPQQSSDLEEPKSTTEKENNLNLKDNFNSAVLKSIILPGWGHLTRGSTTKGWVIGALSLGSLSSAIYFTIDTHSKEEAYLNEINRSIIQSRYEEFNAVYKKRNVFIVAYAVVWLYTQIDLLYFTDNSKPPKINSAKLPSLRFDGRSYFMVRFSFTL